MPYDKAQIDFRKQTAIQKTNQVLIYLRNKSWRRTRKINIA
jgi:hypothetical protein